MSTFIRSSPGFIALEDRDHGQLRHGGRRPGQHVLLLRPFAGHLGPRKKLISVKTFSTARTGTLKIQVTSTTGRAVYMDGVVARRS